MTSYRPMTLADLGRRLAGVDDVKTRWKLVWEFLEEYRWEPDDVQASLLNDEPPGTGDERWDALLAALAEHLAAQHGRAAPNGPRCEYFSGRGSRRNWRSSELMRWSGRRRHSASTASTCLSETWRPRDRTG